MDDKPAAPGSIALDPHVSAVGVHEMFHNGEAESGPTEFARAGFIHPIEPFEHARAVGFRNADPGVCHYNLNHGA